MMLVMMTTEMVSTSNLHIHQAERSKKTTFAAVIGHSDEPEMLRDCIWHALGIGFERVFVSLNDHGVRSAYVLQEPEWQGRVLGVPVEDFATDPFEFFTAAVGVVREWCSPEWLAFFDSDEFWVPKAGGLSGLNALENHDLLVVRRFNAPLIEGLDTMNAPVGEESLLFALPHEPTNDAWDGSGWISTRIAPKVMVRPELVTSIGRGAHDVIAHHALRRQIPDDILICHFPFTTLSRFERKIDSINRRLATYGERFAPNQALHWKRWIRLDDEALIAAEFQRQVIPRQLANELVNRGILANRAAIFEAWARP